MGRRRQERQLPAEVPAICRRFGWLLRGVWGGNVTMMARDIRTSQTALSRVLAGQYPSGKMLEGLAAHAQINSRWVLTGQGAERAEGVGTVLRPIAARLLPGQPSDFPEQLLHVTLPAASPHLLEGAYWVQVGGDDPVVRSKDQKVARGDYLLVETAERWTRRPAAFLGRLVVLRHGTDGCLLAWVSLRAAYFEEAVEHELETFGVLPRASLRLKPAPARRGLQPRTGAEEREPVVFVPEDVVGVVLQIIRFVESNK
jgi:hypothetical protein